MRRWTKLTGRCSSHNNDKQTDAVAADYWCIAPEQLLAAVGSSPQGLSQTEAERRLQHFGPNAIYAGSQDSALRLLLNQFKSPLVLILVVAAVISAIAGDWPDALIVLLVVFGSTTLDFVQE